MIRSMLRLGKKRNVHLLHIGKTGGNAIQNAMRPHIAQARHRIIFCHHGIRLRDIPAGENVIFFLRDPIDRYASGFFSRRRKGQPRNNIPWSDEERIAFEEFHTPNELAAALSSANEEQRDRAQSAMQNIAHVRRPYSYWFESEEYLKSRTGDILFYGRMEKLSSDFERLKIKLGIPKAATLPKDDIKAHRSPAGEDRTMSESAILNLRNWYREDFRLLEFCEKGFLLIFLIATGCI